MKHSAPLFLLCFACAGAPETVDSSDLKQVKKTAIAMLTQPDSDPDDEALMSDERERILLPVGESVEPKALAALFADGRGEWSLGDDARGTQTPELQLVRYLRHCNKVTDCTPWQAEIVVMLSSLTLSLSDDGKLTLSQFDMDGRLLIEAKLTADKTPVTLVAHQYDDALDSARFLATLRDGSVTLETLVNEREFDDTSIEQFGWSMQFTFDLKAQTEREPVAPAPTVKHSIACEQPAATWDQLVAWFEQGKTTATFPSSENFTWSRQCHALTGCSKWAVDDKAALLKSLLVISGNKIAVQSSHDDSFTLENSAFKSGTDIDILVGASCARGRAHRAVPGEFHNKLDLFESSVSIRGAGPGGA